MFKHTKRQNINNNDEDEDEDVTSSDGPDAVPNNVEPTTAAAAGMFLACSRHLFHSTIFPCDR